MDVIDLLMKVDDKFSNGPPAVDFSILTQMFIS